MIEGKIPREISRYEPRLIGPFSLRQAACASFAVLVCYGIYTAGASALSQEQLVALIVFLSIPPGLIGWVKPYGLPFETFFFRVLYRSLTFPAVRTWELQKNRPLRLLEKGSA